MNSKTITAGVPGSAGAAASASGRQRDTAKAVISGAIGNILEWYDFTVYAYLAAILGSKFFHTGDETTALLSTFAVFGVGFFARPFGGILIGMFGDRYGRKPALMLTFGMIAGSTGLIGVLPTYETIGLAAPVLLVLARLLQGISAGGEWGGAASFLVEWAPSRRRGLYGSLHPCAVCVGLLLGSGVTGGLTTVLGQDVMVDWGWRIPFLLGAVVGPIGWYVRRQVHETPVFTKAKEQARAGVVRAPAEPMSRTIVTAFAFPAVQSVIVYLILGYFPTFSQKYLGVASSTSLWSTAFATVMMGVFCVFAGWLSDKVGRKRCMMATSVLFILLSYPAIHILLSKPPLGVIVAVQAVLAALCGVFLGGMAAALVEMFPTARRLTGLTIAYNLQSVLFGGFAPFIASWLIASTGQPVSISYFMILSAVISVIGVSRLRETAFQELQ
jgi:MHS family proline/betaine transporter-like MFS transporter